jgi:hypothetical protein
MERRTLLCVVTSKLVVSALVVLIASRTDGADHIDAKEVEPVGAPPESTATDVRFGGVLQESFAYHRPGYGDPQTVGRASSHRTIAPSGGWYGYGFPVQTYRWGWFGAGRYYPHVVWHRGYYDDCCRWAHRHGY